MLRNPLLPALAAAQAVMTTVAVLVANPGSQAPAHPVRPDIAIGLVSNTLLAMGGNTNPAGLTPDMQLLVHGLVDTRANPDSPYYGWDFDAVEWPAQIWLPILGNWAYEPAQQVGQRNFANAVGALLPTLDPGEQIVALGYSSSANVMIRQMRALQGQTERPADDQLSFILVGNPNRPNGGVLQRFSGGYVPLVDIPMDGSTPLDVPYRTTDVSWEYDPASDFPLYPLNLLAVLNSLVGGIVLHSNYIDADVDGPRAFPDTTRGAITYVTLEPPRLPLLMPLHDAGFPEPLLDLVEPVLTVIIDWAYDRSIDPGTPTAARLIPPIPATAMGDLVDAVVRGVRDFADANRPRPGATLGVVSPRAQVTRPIEHRAQRAARDRSRAGYSPSSGRADPPSDPSPDPSPSGSASRTLTSIP